MDENIDFLLSYNVILVCNLHVNAGILHHYFSILWVTSQYYFALKCLRKALPSTTLYYKARTKHFPVLLYVLQSLHKVLPSTTLYYKACTKHFPVLLCTTKLAQTTSQYYFVLQSLHKVLPSTTLYCKACKEHFPVLLCTTKLAQITSQYYFVLESLHKTRSSTTLYYKACTKHVPVLLCTTFANSDQLRDLIRKQVAYPNSRVPMRSC